MVREVGGWEAPYEQVKGVRSLFHSRECQLLTSHLQHLPKRDDLTPLTDPNWIAKILSDFPSELAQGEGAKTGWRGLGTKVEYTQLA